MPKRLIAAALLLLFPSCAGAHYTFAHITDTHVTGDPKTYQDLKMRGADWPQITSRWSAARQNIIDGVNKAKPDFVIVTGDLTETGLGFEYTSLIDWMEKLEAPVYLITGNHDVIWRDNLPASAPTRGRSLLNYERVFGRSWYSFKHKDSYFLMLNSMVDASDAPPAYKARGELQERWLAREINYAQNAGYPFVFAFSHHPLPTTPGIADLLSKSPVSAVLYGHIHRYTAGQHKGVLQISGTSVKGGANAINQPSYGLVRVAGDKATYQLYDTDGAPVFEPVDISRANNNLGTLWQTRQQLFPKLPASTHEQILSTPY